jgi:lysophospholipase L1-like esterase
MKHFLLIAVASLTSWAQTAQFVKTDSATLGAWRGVYGTVGYVLANESTQLPSYASVAPTGQANYTWAPSTADLRAVQKASGSDRIAACWYSGTNFTVDVNFTDALVHQVALYVLDWDSASRAETIEVRDTGGSVLDSRSVSGFGQGRYVVYNVSGHVNFRVSLAGGLNAVVSGVFIDPVSGSPPPPDPSVGILCIGDSITRSTGSSPPLDQCLLIATALNAFTGTNNYVGYNAGVNGSTTGDWIAGSANLNYAIGLANANNATIALIMLGTNNSRVGGSAAAYQADMQNMLTALKAAGITKSILNYQPWLDPTGIIGGDNNLLNQYQGVYSILAAADPAHVFVGDTAAWQYFKDHPDQLRDGVHPTNVGYMNLAGLDAVGFEKVLLTPGVTGIFQMGSCSVQISHGSVVNVSGC